MEKNDQFKNYLSSHLGHLISSDAIEHRKKYFRYNYGATFPEDPDASILEIGPGFGDLLHILRVEKGFFNARGIDICDEVVDHCNRLMPESTLKVIDTVSYLEVNLAQFDRVYMFHVLEHIPKSECVRLLTAIRKSLKANGKFLFEVPNMENPLTGLAMRYADFTHEVGFTDRSMCQVLNMAGFSKIRVFGPRLPAYSIPRTLQRLGQSMIEVIAGLLIRLYQPRKQLVLTHAISAECSP